MLDYLSAKISSQIESYGCPDDSSNPVIDKTQPGSKNKPSGDRHHIMVEWCNHYLEDLQTYERSRCKDAKIANKIPDSLLAAKEMRRIEIPEYQQHDRDNSQGIPKILDFSHGNEGSGTTFKYMCGISHTMIDVLQRIGLTETEALIYVQLVKKGAMTAIEIAKEMKTHRRTIYDNLNILMNKGLVTFFTFKSIRYFKANNPVIPKNIEEEKLKGLKLILPHLQSYYANQKKNPTVEIMKGTDATRNLLFEMHNTHEEILWMGGGFRLLDALDSPRERIIQAFGKLHLKIIQPKPKNDLFKKYFSHCTIKFLDKKYATGSVFFTFRDLVLIGTLVNDDFFIIKIQSKDLAKTYQNYFEIIWNAQ